MCPTLTAPPNGVKQGTNPCVRGLKCRECGALYEIKPTHVCSFCFGPLEIDYDYGEIGRRLTREVIESRPANMWRYKELLPLDGEPTVGAQVGYTPLIRAHNLAAELGVKELWIKNDAVNYPTLSFKDRVVSVALSKAREFGYTVAACASTGNLANSVAANAAAAGMPAYVFIPADLEQGKILSSLIYGARIVAIHGTYDEVNRLCSEIANKYPWAIVNVNIRPFYAEGSKAMGYEIAEQLGWKLPRHTISPMAGGSLITKIYKAYGELKKLGFVADTPVSVWGAQATGCNPITAAVKAGNDLIPPIKKPNTIAKSLAIGNPADGYYAYKIMNATGGGEDVSDEEIVDSMKLLARTEGIFTETAGGVTLGVLRKLLAQGRIPRDESIALLITGNGLKTQEALVGKVGEPVHINARLEEVDEVVAADGIAAGK